MIKKNSKQSQSPNKGSRPSTGEQNQLSNGFQNRTKQLPEISKQIKKNSKSENLHQYLQNAEFQDILLTEKDERYNFYTKRYRYLVKHGTIRRIENNGNIIFSELPQVQGTWVCYRRPIERQNYQEKLQLDYLDLTHIPLLEGEEKLRVLTYQHNRIIGIQNLVSLPNLLYLDMYDNQIKEIEELKQVPKLKVLLLPKNQIRKIQNIDHLTKLEVLDLHSNRIMNMEGLNKLKNLRILNLGNNLISKIEGIDDMPQLQELNLKINQIENIDNLNTAQQLQKLYLSQNKLVTFPPPLSLTELTLESNPIAIKRNDYLRQCVILYEHVKLLDGRPIENLKAEIIIEPPKTEPLKKNQKQSSVTPPLPKVKKQNQMGLEVYGISQEPIFNKSDVTSLNARIPKSMPQSQPTTTIQSVFPQSIQSLQTPVPEQADAEEDVLNLIKQQWQKEFKRIQKLEKQNVLTKKSLLQHATVEGGHAEVEEDTFLLCYGTAFQIVLTQHNFDQIIEKIHFQYAIYDSLIESQIQVLKKYNKLKEIIFKDNYISGLIQVAKLENMSQLKNLVIQNNPICNCSFLFQFLVYRFPLLLQINSKDIRPEDKNKAKVMFQNFDKTLQIPEKNNQIESIRLFKSSQKDKNCLKIQHKVAHDISQEYLPQTSKRKNIEQAWEEYITQLILKQ